jgi:HNH endonuclease
MPPLADAVQILAYGLGLAVALGVLGLFLAILGRVLAVVLWALHRLTRQPPQGVYVRVPLAAEVRARVMARDGFRCLECGAVEDLTVDHIIPVAHGGTNEMSNLRTLCRHCNSRKGTHED